MRRSTWAGAAGLLILGACLKSLPPVEVEPLSRTVSYLGDVKPVLDARCVTCHSCYNAPCQVQLSSFEGADRGGSKSAVYQPSRLVYQAPTRLFVDAQTTSDWRSRDFHDVLRSSTGGAYNDSILIHLLDAKRRIPESSGSYRSEPASQSCPADTRELAGFLERPERGMPFGFPALSDPEYTVIATWLQQGAPGPSPEEQRALTTPGPKADAQIARWESFLNRDDPKFAMTARYLYEHLFLARLHFEGSDTREFYRLVRSTSPPGEPIDSVIATVRPYDDPDVDVFYYRFRKIHSTPVYKTHMVVELGDATLARYRALFIESDWLETPHWVKLDEKRGANPFRIYAQIPPRVRYQFLLDHSEYIMRTFIRGPVCDGQVALNVIHDQFWVMFLDPEADRTVQNPDFLAEQVDNLRLPTEKGSSQPITRTFSNRYRERYAAFYRAKTELYDATDPEGLGLDAIWRGRRPSDAPVLTVFRHFDSASVHKGVLGGLPRTLWVIDYPQFERIYYALVAGFDVFGNVTHQVNVRRYMDYLRIEGELNFLEFLPVESRLPTLLSWYIGDRAVENVQHENVLTSRPAKIPFETDDPKREFVEMVVDEHILKSTGIVFDDINYQRDGRVVPMPASFETHEDILNGLRALTAPGTGFIRHNNEWGVNVILVRVRDYEGEDVVFTIVINRWHDNVNSLFGEQRRLDPSKDTIDFIRGSVGAYPNYFLDVAAEDVPDLFDLLENFDGSEAYLAKIDKYGVNRADTRFWETFDWFQARLDAADPLRAGLYDLNRYYHEAFPGLRE